MVDFVTEMTRPNLVDDATNDLIEWKLYVDGLSTERRSRVKIIIITPDQITIHSMIGFSFKAFNNEVKYEALLGNLRLLKLLV